MYNIFYVNHLVDLYFANFIPTSTRKFRSLAFRESREKGDASSKRLCLKI